MCEFFSCLSDGKGNLFYFNEKLRRQLRSNNGKINNVKYKPDSHSSIASYFNINEDKHNKYEFYLDHKFVSNLGTLKIDEDNTDEDYDLVCEKLKLIKNYKKMHQISYGKPFYIYTIICDKVKEKRDAFRSNIKDIYITIIHTNFIRKIQGKVLIGSKVKIIKDKCKYFTSPLDGEYYEIKINDIGVVDDIDFLGEDFIGKEDFHVIFPNKKTGWFRSYEVELVK